MSAIERLLDQLATTIKSPEMDAEKLKETLWELYRRNVAPVTLQIHVERLRAVNEVQENSQTVEDHALAALDMIVYGEVPTCNNMCESTYAHPECELHGDPAEVRREIAGS